MSGIVIAPFSNSGIRDWPGSHFARLIGLLLDRVAPTEPLRIIGMASQRLRACEIVRSHPATRVLNQCGRLSWEEMVAMVRGARCVIANNSGVSHLGGHFGVPTVSIFAGTHNRREWGALGSSVVIVSRVIGCSPCQLDHGQVSPYDKACLREISPEAVADAVEAALGRAGRAGLAAEAAA